MRLLDLSPIKAWPGPLAPAFWLSANKCRCRAGLKSLPGIEKSKELDDLGHKPGPAGLVARAEPGTIVAVKVFVEQDKFAPVRVGLEFRRVSVNGPPPMLITQENSAISVMKRASRFLKARKLLYLRSPKSLWKSSDSISSFRAVSRSLSTSAVVSLNEVGSNLK